MDARRIYGIDEIARLVAPIAEDFGIRKMSVFGSYARGDAIDSSDIDFHIIDRGTLRGLIRLSAFELALEDVFQAPVDVMTTNSLFDDVRHNVRREEIIVYEA